MRSIQKLSKIENTMLGVAANHLHKTLKLCGYSKSESGYTHAAVGMSLDVSLDNG